MPEYIIKQRVDTPSNWTAANPVLADRELGWIEDGTSVLKVKMGDGVTLFNDLPILTGPTGPVGPEPPLATPTSKGSVPAGGQPGQVFGVSPDGSTYGFYAINLVSSPSYQKEGSRFIEPYALSRNGLVIKAGTYIKIGTGSSVIAFYTDVDYNLPNVVDFLDTGSALSPGKDYYVYLCLQAGNTFTFRVSMNATFPNGFTADNSRKIGGFHSLCLAVGAIAGHKLSGYLTADILPASIWDLSFRAANQNEGSVYDSNLDYWPHIYLQSGTGTGTRSAFGGTVTRTRQQLDHVEDMFRVGKRLLTDTEFMSSMEGSNQETNIFGSVQPETTGGHTDTAGRRMISDIGCEDGVGAYWQWLQEVCNLVTSVDAVNTYKSGYTDNGAYRGGNPKVAISITDSRVPGFTWIQRNNETKGQTYNLTGLLAGGYWGHGAACGSRTRLAYNSRLICYVSVGARGAANTLRS